MSIPVPDGPDGPVGVPGLRSARNRLVGLGLGLVVVGWGVLVADLALASAQLQAGSLVAVLSLKADIATVAEMLIVTGLGIAILGGLREGFGALDRFFGAVLQRSTAARPVPTPEPPPVDLGDVAAAPRRGAAERAVAPIPTPAAATSQMAASQMSPSQMSPSPERNYQILPDGSVEVETLLGTRVFASMEEARDFIR